MNSSVATSRMRSRVERSAPSAVAEVTSRSYLTTGKQFLTVWQVSTCRSASQRSEVGMTANMIEAVGLTKRYGDHVAVDGVDLAVPSGRILGVLGPNGAGKSTTVRMLTTMTTPDGGTGHVGGIDVARDPGAVRRI